MHAVLSQISRPVNYQSSSCSLPSHPSIFLPPKITRLVPKVPIGPVKATRLSYKVQCFQISTIIYSISLCMWPALKWWIWEGCSPVDHPVLPAWELLPRGSNSCSHQHGTCVSFLSNFHICSQSSHLKNEFFLYLASRCIIVRIVIGASVPVISWISGTKN